MILSVLSATLSENVMISFIASCYIYFFSIFPSVSSHYHNHYAMFFRKGQVPPSPKRQNPELQPPWESCKRCTTITDCAETDKAKWPGKGCQTHIWMSWASTRSTLWMSIRFRWTYLQSPIKDIEQKILAAASRPEVWFSDEAFNSSEQAQWEPSGSQQNSSEEQVWWAAQASLFWWTSSRQPWSSSGY